MVPLVFKTSLRAVRFSEGSTPSIPSPPHLELTPRTGAGHPAVSVSPDPARATPRPHTDAVGDGPRRYPLVHHGILAVSLPLITRDFGITYTQLGALRSVHHAYPTSSASPPAGLATDFLKDRKGILLFSLVWPSLFFSLQGFSTHVPHIRGRSFAPKPWREGSCGTRRHEPSSATGSRTAWRIRPGHPCHGGAISPPPPAPAIMGAVLAWVTDRRTVFTFQFLPRNSASRCFLWLLLPRLGRAPRDRQGVSYGRALRSDVLTNLH